MSRSIEILLSSNNMCFVSECLKIDKMFHKICRKCKCKCKCKCKYKCKCKCKCKFSQNDKMPSPRANGKKRARVCGVHISYKFTQPPKLDYLTSASPLLIIRGSKLVSFPRLPASVNLIPLEHLKNCLKQSLNTHPVGKYWNF